MDRATRALDGRLWAAIEGELDRWCAEGRTVRLWLRDDDADAPSAQLDRLVALSERFDVSVLLAVVPMTASLALARRLSGAVRLHPCQHGFSHRNHALPHRKAEFGPQRPLDAMAEEAAAGWRRLADLFGARAVPVFVPPWNRIDPALVARLPRLGFRGLSSFQAKPVPATPGLAIVSSDLDVIDWKAGRVGRPHEVLVAELHARLAAQRENGTEHATLGVLMHHLVHDETAWSFMADLLSAIRFHPAVAMTEPRELFGIAPAAPTLPRPERVSP